MAELRTLSDSYNNATNRYLINQDQFLRQTDSKIEKKANLLRPEPSSQTDAKSDIEGLAFSIQETRPIPIAREAGRDNHVFGAVIQVNDVSVKSELIIDNKNIEIELPKSLFPEDVQYGTSFRLEMTEEGGFRRPKITVRTPDPAHFSELRQSLEAIIQEL